MIDPLRQEAVMQGIPAARFVGMDGGAGRHAGADRLDALRLAFEHEGERDAVALAHDDHDLTLAGLVLRKATVDPIGFVVCRLHVPAEVGAIDFYGALERRVGRLGRHGLAQLVREHEGCFVLHVQVAAKLKGRMTLGAIDEDRDGQEIGHDRQLAAGEDRSARDGELIAAGLAIPLLAGRDLESGRAVAAGANGLAFGLGPTDHAEGIVRFLVRHASNPS